MTPDDTGTSSSSSSSKRRELEACPTCGAAPKVGPSPDGLDAENGRCRSCGWAAG